MSIQHTIQPSSKSEDTPSADLISRKGAWTSNKAGTSAPPTSCSGSSSQSSAGTLTPKPSDSGILSADHMSAINAFIHGFNIEAQLDICNHKPWEVIPMDKFRQRHEEYVDTLAVCERVNKMKLQRRGKGNDSWNTCNEAVSLAKSKKEEAKTAFNTAFDEASKECRSEKIDAYFNRLESEIWTPKRLAQYASNIKTKADEHYKEAAITERSRQIRQSKRPPKPRWGL
jgi:hypothetical protein